MATDAIAKYLSRHAESATADLAAVSGAWSHAVVIPCAAEGPAFFQTLQSLEKAADSCGARPLVVVVINGRLDAPEHVHQANVALDDALSQRATAESAAHDGLRTLVVGALTLLVCARHREGARFPADQGVGLARKLGCDLALALWAAGRIDDPWLRTTDADAEVPSDYFAGPAISDVAAFIYPFVHDPAPPALVRYEIKLRYVALGLHWAGSPYAYQAVGSTIAVHAGAYAKVHGFPKRLAAEDFYFLDKLAKLGGILRSRRSPIRLRGRPSDRVPFGTGAGMAQIAADEGQGQPLHLYAPEVWDALRAWLTQLRALRAADDLETMTPEWAVNRHGGALSRILSQDAPPETRDRQLETYFDAIRTLRFLHITRDGGLPSIPWREALERAPFIPTLDAHADASALLEALQTYESELMLGAVVGPGSSGR